MERKGDSLSNNSVREWRLGPVTREILLRLKHERSDEVHSLVQGNSIQIASASETAINTAWRVGYIAGLSKILDFKGDTSNDEEEEITE